MTRLTIVQYAGDYRRAVENFDAGGPETYRAQHYSVGLVASLAARLEQVAVVAGVTDTAYDERLANGVRAVGCGGTGQVDVDALVAAAQRTEPTHVVVATPQGALLRWTTRAKLPTIAVLADSFQRGTWRARLRNRLSAHRLNAPNIAWVGNHGLNACLSLLDIGVDPRRVVPWDWPPSTDPRATAPRRRGDGPLRLVYVGSVIESKGVGDLIDAVARLRAAGSGVTAAIVGKDADGVMQARAAAAGVADAVTCLGLVPNDRVSRLMAEADAVVVPSRHDYPEGLPLTIYEALGVRTPLIASDHPMFRGAIVDGVSALVFAAADPAALAAAIARLDGDPALYERLSTNASDAWQKLQLPVTWGDLLTRWLDSDPAAHAWLAARSIASGIYDERLAERRAALGLR